MSQAHQTTDHSIMCRLIIQMIMCMDIRMITVATMADTMADTMVGSMADTVLIVAMATQEVLQAQD